MAIKPPPAIALAGTAGDRLRQFGEPVLSVRRLRLAVLPAARPARALSDRRDADGDPRGRSVGGLARDQLHALEGLRIRHRLRDRGRGRRLLCELRRHARPRCLHHHRIIHDSGHGDRRRDGNADRAGLGRDPAHGLARAAARLRRFSPRPLRRLRSRSSSCSCPEELCRRRASCARAFRERPSLGQPARDR